MGEKAERPAAAQRTRERSSSRGRFASLGAVGSGFLASLCCIGPLLFVTFGVGAGLSSTFEPLRPLFTVLTAGFLAVSFYTVYGRKPKATPAGAEAGDGCAPEDGCAAPRRRARDKILLWTATVLAALSWSFTYWSRLLV